MNDIETLEEYLYDFANEAMDLPPPIQGISSCFAREPYIKFGSISNIFDFGEDFIQEVFINRWECWIESYIKFSLNYRTEGQDMSQYNPYYIAWRKRPKFEFFGGNMKLTARLLISSNMWAYSKRCVR